MPTEGLNQKPSPRERALWTAGVCVLWVLVYGGCNWITSQRSDVRSLQFAWEKHIPLIPWMIVPYMSIDLFFLGGPWICRTRRELHVLCTRLIAATLGAGYFFLMAPLTLAGRRPHFDGWPGAIYDFLKAGDQPYNLCPSLHVALLLLLWPVYHRATRGALRMGLHTWFSLVLLSILPVYQHHFIDVVGGAALAVACVWAFPMPHGWPDTPREERHGRLIGVRYAALSLPLLALGIWLGPRWGLGGLAAWIGGSLVLVACAYLFAGPGMFRKSGGRLPAGTRLLFGPYLLGLHITRRYWAGRMEHPWNRVGKSLIIGRRPRGHEMECLVRKGVVAVLDPTAEHDAPTATLRLPSLNLPVLDLTPPSATQCRRAVAFIREHAARGPVFVYCGLGFSRSATVGAAYLLACGEARTVESACAAVLACRPGVVFGPEESAILREFHGSLRSLRPPA